MTGGPQLMIRLCPERCSEEHTCIKGTGGGASGSNAQQVDHQPVFLQVPVLIMNSLHLVYQDFICLSCISSKAILMF